MKELADDNFKFDENGRKFTQMPIELLLEKKKLLLTSNIFFPSDLNCRHIKPGLVWERVNYSSQISSSTLFILHFHFFLLYQKAPFNCTREVAKW